MIKSAAERTSRWGVVFLAAAKATGIAITIAMMVPMVAMFTVSQAGFHNCDMYDHLGGTIRAPISAAWRGASCTKNQMVFSEIRCQAKETMAMPINQAAQFLNCGAVARCFQERSPFRVIVGIIEPTFLETLSKTQASSQLR